MKEHLSFHTPRFLSPSRTWAEAKRICEEDYNAKLVEIDSEEENRVVNKELKRNGYDHAWLGITDQNTEGKWLLESTGQPAAFKAWRIGEPNNMYGYKQEDCCITSWGDNKWNDVQCVFWAPAFAVVCENV